jgi:hypothetical protein
MKYMQQIHLLCANEATMDKQSFMVHHHKILA